MTTFYQGNVSQMQGQSLEAMAPAINRFLTNQRRTQARETILDELRKKGPAIRVALEAPRLNVAIAASNPTLGRATAPVTLVEFSDYQCPSCQRVEPTLKRLRETYGDRIRFVWKDFPLTRIHPQAFKAGEAAHCAGDQGESWELHDVLFDKQQELQPPDLKRHAAELGLDANAFNQCLDSSKYGERVRDGVSEGGALGVNSTPTIFINGRRLSGAQPSKRSRPSSTKSSRERNRAGRAHLFSFGADRNRLQRHDRSRRHDRGVFETLDLRVARHPSATTAYMLVRAARLLPRVLGRASRSQRACRRATIRRCSCATSPAASPRWIEVGLPDADRLHRGTKLAGRAAVYTHRDVRQLLAQLGGEDSSRGRDPDSRLRPAGDRRAGRAYRSADIAGGIGLRWRADHLDRRPHVHARDDGAPIGLTMRSG